MVWLLVWRPGKLRLRSMRANSRGYALSVVQGAASSVSGYVQHAVSVSLDDVAGWGAMLADALRDSGENCLARNEVGRTTSLVLPTIRGVLPPSGWDDP